MNAFIKYDSGKPVYSLIPPAFEEALAQILTVGAVKYTDENWRLCKTPWRTYYSALRRHLAACARGDRTDPESGLSHLAHAAACLAFLYEFERQGLLDQPADGREGLPPQGQK